MQLEKSLKQLKLPSFIAHYQSAALEFEQQRDMSVIKYLEILVQLELDSRAQNKVARLVNNAGLHNHKLLAEFELKEVPSLLPSKLYGLAKAEFINNAENLLIFGGTGTGKSHLCSGLAHKWCLLGKRVYYAKGANLVAELAGAEASSSLIALRRKIGRNDIVIIDDFLLHQYTKVEQSLLMSLLSDYYETKSIVISAHLPFIKWGESFSDEVAISMMVDKLIHHSIIIELNTESYRVKQAKKKQLDSEVQNPVVAESELTIINNKKFKGKDNE